VNLTTCPTGSRLRFLKNITEEVYDDENSISTGNLVAGSVDMGTFALEPSA
jgi:hypothetical protein